MPLMCIMCGVGWGSRNRNSSLNLFLVGQRAIWWRVLSVGVLVVVLWSSFKSPQGVFLRYHWLVGVMLYSLVEEEEEGK